jgi:hypothetical protein
MTRPQGSKCVHESGVLTWLDRSAGVSAPRRQRSRVVGCGRPVPSTASTSHPARDRRSSRPTAARPGRGRRRPTNRQPCTSTSRRGSTPGLAPVALPRKTDAGSALTHAEDGCLLSEPLAAVVFAESARGRRRSDRTPCTARAAASRPHRQATATWSPTISQVGMRVSPRSGIRPNHWRLGGPSPTAWPYWRCRCSSGAPPLQPRGGQHRRTHSRCQTPARPAAPRTVRVPPQGEPKPVLQPVPMCRTPF